MQGGIGTPTPGLTQDSFNAAWIAAQPAAVKKLIAMPAGNQGQITAKETEARDLAGLGYLIDVPLMCWEWDPYLITLQRIAAGYTWVPSALMPPILDGPGFPGFGNIQAYNPQIIPAGSIIVTLEIDLLPKIFTPAKGTEAAAQIASGAKE